MSPVAPSRGRGSKLPAAVVSAPQKAVAPSRGRGSKPARAGTPTLLTMSPPRGGADRNSHPAKRLCCDGRRPLAGARIETRLRSVGRVGPWVAPSRGRGSKPFQSRRSRQRPCRPLAGARIETCRWIGCRASTAVAPSRGRGSKPNGAACGAQIGTSPPRGGADRNGCLRSELEIDPCRPLAGARIETIVVDPSSRMWMVVAPSRGRGSKHQTGMDVRSEAMSPPRGGADRNKAGGRATPGAPGRPLAGARIETSWVRLSGLTPAVAPLRGRGSKLSGRPHRG